MVYDWSILCLKRTLLVSQSPDCDVKLKSRDSVSVAESMSLSPQPEDHQGALGPLGPPVSLALQGAPELPATQRPSGPLETVAPPEPLGPLAPLTAPGPLCGSQRFPSLPEHLETPMQPQDLHRHVSDPVLPGS